jgi:folate-binding protein YgfZ
MTLDAKQYRIINAPSGAGWHDKRRYGRLRFDGRDAASFLHALVTNDVQSLAPGQGAYAAYLTPQGRMIADLHLYRCATHVIADVPPGLSVSLAARFDLLIFSEDVHVSDVSAEISQLGIAGRGAAAVLAEACGFDRTALEHAALWSHLEAGPFMCARTDQANVPTFDLFCPSAEWPGLVAGLEKLGAIPLPDDMVTALRVDAGTPEFGVDMSDETIPLEAGLLSRAISTTKGCYVGQEVIVRVLHRGGGRVARRLVRVDFGPAGGSIPEAGAVISADGRESGTLTTVAVSPASGHLVALGYAHRDFAESGRMVSVRAGGAELTGGVTPLPVTESTPDRPAEIPAV